MKKTLTLFPIFVLLAAINCYAETITIVCDYPKYSDETGVHSVTEDFTLTFVIDKEKELAYIIGNQGSAEVITINTGEKGTTFVEITPIGNVMTTTIDGSGNTVHSRNTLLPNGLVPTQYYGIYVIK